MVAWCCGGTTHALCELCLLDAQRVAHGACGNHHELLRRVLLDQVQLHGMHAIRYCEERHTQVAAFYLRLACTVAASAHAVAEETEALAAAASLTNAEELPPGVVAELEAQVRRGCGGRAQCYSRGFCWSVP